MVKRNALAVGMLTAAFVLTLLGALFVGGAARPANGAPAGPTGAAGADSVPAAPASGQIVLEDTSLWRTYYTWKTPLVRKQEGGPLKPEGISSSYGPIFEANTPPPPAAWFGADFDDSTWSLSRNRHHLRVDYGFEDSSPMVAMVCLRSRFKVDDPTAVRGLKLSLSFRGGVVVYVNGKEIARASLPKDQPITPDALADDYPTEVFLKANKDQIGIFSVHSDGIHIYSDKEALDKRIREVKDVAIAPANLVKGVNVLAVEVHRAPYFGNGLQKENGNHVSSWSTCGLVRLGLRADGGVTATTARPKGVQVFGQNSLHRSTPLDYADPLESGPAPVRIVGCRNGRFTGKALVASDAALSGIEAVVSDLTDKEGKAIIPASAIKVFYSTRDDKQLMGKRMDEGFWDALLGTSPAKVDVDRSVMKDPNVGAIQPIVLKVAVPADAAAGDYAGKFTVTVAGHAPIDLPVQLRVVGWKLPDPADYVTHMGIIESPESVAMQYKVPLWSEEHWKLIEKSFQLMGEFGNKYIVIPMICKTNFGNEQSMIRWVKDGDGWKYDFTLFDRYVDLAMKYQKMDAVCLYIWDRYTGWMGWGRSEPSAEPLVTLWDPQTKTAQEMKAPKFDSPEGDKTWGPLLTETLAHLEKRGLGDAAMLGINAEWGPTEGISKAYLKWWPKLKWISNKHADTRGDKIGGLLPVAYNTAVYLTFCLPGNTLWTGEKTMPGRNFGWQTRTDIFPRGAAQGTPLWPDAHLAAFRLTMEVGFSVKCSGLGRAGCDFWPVLLNTGYKRPYTDDNSKRSYTLTARFPGSSWEQVNVDTGCEAMLAPGPEGAVPTERFEQVRQGVQDCEARVFIEKAVLSGKLDPETVRKCWSVIDDRQWRIHSACTHWACFEGTDAIGSAEQLYSMAAEVAGKLGAAGK